MNNQWLLVLLLLLSRGKDFSVAELLPYLTSDKEILPILTKLLTPDNTAKEAPMPEYKEQNAPSWRDVANGELLREISAYQSAQAEKR